MHKNIRYILFFFFLSQIFFLRVFALDENQMYVINNETNQCSVFTKGNLNQANWLPEDWESVDISPLLSAKFRILEACKQENSSAKNCCIANGFSYTSSDPGIKEISEIRKSAEFLAGKGIIEKHSFDAKNYNLESNISRREFIKIILQAGNISGGNTCIGIFSDVAKSDWSCKYIEQALQINYISQNTLFRPDDTVSISEALKLIFRARNIEKRYDTGDWQQDFLASAYYIGLTDERILDPNLVLTRGEIFQILARTYDNFKEY